MWTENFQTYKLDLEKVEEPEIKLPTSIGLEKAREFQRNICFIDYMKALVWVTTNYGKFLKRWEYQTTLPVSWETCILSPFLLNLYTEYIMQNARLVDSQAGIKVDGRNNNNLRYADDTTLMAESKEN